MIARTTNQKNGSKKTKGKSEDGGLSYFKHTIKALFFFNGRESAGRHLPSQPPHRNTPFQDIRWMGLRRTRPASDEANERDLSVVWLQLGFLFVTRQAKIGQTVGPSSVPSFEQNASRLFGQQQLPIAKTHQPDGWLGKELVDNA